MRLTHCLAVLAAVSLPAGPPARADDCPVRTTQMDDVIAALNQSPGCGDAMKVFGACAYGSSADVQFGAAVEQKCEADFLAGLKPREKQAYQREMGVCDGKHRKQSGTMSQSATAFCRANVAQRYSQRALKAVGTSAR